MNDVKGQVASQASAEFMRAYHAQAHVIVDAISAALINAEAGLNWLCAEPPDLEGARRALNGIAGDGKRVTEVVAQLRALMNNAAPSGLNP